MSVGQAAFAEAVGAAEDATAGSSYADGGAAVAVGAADVEEAGLPSAAQLNPPVLKVTLSQPVVFCNASLKML